MIKKKNHTHLNMHVHLKTAYQVLVYLSCLLRGTKNIHAIFSEQTDTIMGLSTHWYLNLLYVHNRPLYETTQSIVE